LLLPDEEIKQFVQLISQNLHRLRDFPYLFPNVQDVYHLSVRTYKMNIGKQYAIFYRVNEDQKTVLIGSLFSNKQMKIAF
jgi:plasmid stabilization system protein ParE